MRPSPLTGTAQQRLAKVLELLSHLKPVRGWGAVTAYAQENALAFKTKLHKALIVNQPTEDELKRVKDAGFDGVEAGGLPPLEAETCRKDAEKSGMRIHSVLRGWAQFNRTDLNKLARTLNVTQDALRVALDQIGYNGWLRIAGGDLSTAEHSKRLDLIIAGN